MIMIISIHYCRVPYIVESLTYSNLFLGDCLLVWLLKWLPMWLLFAFSLLTVHVASPSNHCCGGIYSWLHAYPSHHTGPAVYMCNAKNERTKGASSAS